MRRNGVIPVPFKPIALALLAFGLVATENVQIVQSSTVVFSLPLLPVLILMSVSMVRWLKRDHG